MLGRQHQPPLFCGRHRFPRGIWAAASRFYFAKNVKAAPLRNYIDLTQPGAVIHRQHMISVFFIVPPGQRFPFPAQLFFVHYT